MSEANQTPMTPADARQAFFGKAEAKPKFFASVHWSGIEGGLRVRSLNLREMEQYHAESDRREKAKLDHRSNERLLIACVCLPDGTPMFTADDEERLAVMDFRQLKKLIKAANEANGFGGKEDDEGNS